MQDMIAADVILKMKNNESAVIQTAGNQKIPLIVENKGEWLNIPKRLEQENCTTDTISKAMQQVMVMQAGYLNDGNIYQQYRHLLKTLAEKYPGKKWIPQENELWNQDKVKRAFREGQKKFSDYENEVTLLSEKLKANGLPLTSLWERFVYGISEIQRKRKSHNKYEPMLLCVCVCVLKICV